MLAPASFENQVAIVTGGGTGIGLAIAQRLGELGARIVVGSRNSKNLESGTAALRHAGLDPLAVQLDVRKPGEVDEMVERTLRHFGRIDILVNNAGVTWAAEPEDMPLEKWQKVVDINLTGAFLFSQAVGRHMLTRQSGRIINIASIAGMHASVEGPHYAAYAATKAGLIGLTRELAVSWARKGIRVNAIAPGFFHSRLADAAIAMNEASIRATSPIPRVGDAGELKGVAVFLAADASNYITGQTIVVDGGRTIA
jgi:NAD(P)-dependent dehydrogenase (short-subunit alcohol dehydrogenase family)